jgi:hypothetical protein
MADTKQTPRQLQKVRTGRAGEGRLTASAGAPRSSVSGRVPGVAGDGRVPLRFLRAASLAIVAAFVGALAIQST